MCMSCSFTQILNSRKRVKFGHGQGELLAVESHQRHPQRAVLAGGGDA